MLLGVVTKGDGPGNHATRLALGQRARGDLAIGPAQDGAIRVKDNPAAFHFATGAARPGRRRSTRRTRSGGRIAKRKKPLSKKIAK